MLIQAIEIVASYASANIATNIYQGTVSLATAATSKVASLASALYGVVTSVFGGGGAAVAQTQSTPAIASVVPATTPTPTAVTPAPQPSAPKVAVVERPAATHTPPPTPTPTQAQAPTPPPAQTPTEPLVPTAPLLTLPVGVSPGFGGGGEPKHDPPPESPPPETLPPEASHLLSMIFPKDNQLFSTSSITASGTTTPTTTVTVIWGPTNSSDITVATTTSDEEGVWLIDLTLTEGEIALMAGAYDPTTDATSTDSRVITIDTTPPEAPVVSVDGCRFDLAPAPDCLITSTTTASVLWSAVPDATEYAVYQNGVRAATTSTASYETALSRATTTIEVAAYDVAGNAATSSPLHLSFLSLAAASLTIDGPPIVDMGATVPFLWSVSSVQAESCSLSSADVPWSTALHNTQDDSGATTSPPIMMTTPFILSCSALDGEEASTSMMVGLVPQGMEI